MLTLYAAQLTDLERELAKLTEMLEQKKQMAKVLKATERKANKLIDGLKGLIDELPTDAIANLRDSILSLFPSSPLPVTEDRSGNDLPPVAAPEEFEEPPLIKAIKDLGSDGKNLEQQSKEPVSDIPIASALAELQNAFSRVPRLDAPDAAFSNTPELKAEEQPEAENAITDENPATTTINEFCSFVYLNPTVGYIRMNRGQGAGEIMSSYLGTSSKKLASDWAELITLWGGRTSIRKPERLQDSAIKYEVKIWDLSLKRINFLASHHTDPSSPMPAFSSELSKKQQKKSEESAGKSSGGGNETASLTNSNLTVEESNEKPESSSVETQESKFYFTNVRDYDPLMPEFLSYLKEGNKYLGRVREKLSLTEQGRWQHDALRGTEWQTVSFGSQEEAASDLLRRKQYSQVVHDKTNAQLKQMYSFDEIEKAEAATEDALKKDAIERIDGYMQQLNWTKKQAKEFSIARFGIDHRSKMDLVQLLELAEAMQQQLSQPA